MKITFLNIKFFFGEKLLQKLLKKGNDRQVKSCNVEDAKSMGMICVIKNKANISFNQPLRYLLMKQTSYISHHLRIRSF